MIIGATKVCPILLDSSHARQCNRDYSDLRRLEHGAQYNVAVDLRPVWPKASTHSVSVSKFKILKGLTALTEKWRKSLDLLQNDDFRLNRKISVKPKSCVSAWGLFEKRFDSQVSLTEK